VDGTAMPPPLSIDKQEAEMKKYIAKTNVSVNVVMANGVNRHVAFMPQSGGGSVYYTDIPELQSALEAHYKFGRLFKIDQTYAKKKVLPKKNNSLEPVTDNEGKILAQEVEDGTEKAESEEAGNVIVVTDPDEAKDYLCEHYGLSRTKIKSLKAIKEAATANGITFKGLD